MQVTTESLRTLALDHGASAVGVASAEPFTEARRHLVASVASGRASRLRFTHSEPDVATDVRATYPWATRVVSVSATYAGRAPGPAASGPIVARFATGDQYEQVRAVTDANGATPKC